MKSFFKKVVTSKNVIGLFLCIVLFFVGFTLNGNLGLYFNFSGILLVFFGTFGATLISFRWERLTVVYKVLISSYRYGVREPDEIIEVLVDLSIKSKIKGLLSLQEDEEETAILFLRRALGYLVDGYKSVEIRDLLSTEMYFFKLRRDEIERILRTIAEICPSFGLVGSVVGLISMLAGVGDTAKIIETVPIALTSTLYGIIFANFFFLPFAANIKERTAKELLLQKVILEGVVAIEKQLHPRLLEYKLKSFLTPAARKGSLVSLKRIQEKFTLKKKEAEEAYGEEEPKMEKEDVLIKEAEAEEESLEEEEDED